MPAMVSAWKPARKPQFTPLQIHRRPVNRSRSSRAPASPTVTGGFRLWRVPQSGSGRKRPFCRSLGTSLVPASRHLPTVSSTTDPARLLRPATPPCAQATRSLHPRSCRPKPANPCSFQHGQYHGFRATLRHPPMVRTPGRTPPKQAELSTPNVFVNHSLVRLPRNAPCSHRLACLPITYERSID